MVAALREAGAGDHDIFHLGSSDRSSENLKGGGGAGDIAHCKGSALVPRTGAREHRIYTFLENVKMQNFRKALEGP